jgi:hypothetical protein
MGERSGRERKEASRYGHVKFAGARLSYPLVLLQLTEGKKVISSPSAETAVSSASDGLKVVWRGRRLLYSSRSVW